MYRNDARAREYPLWQEIIDSEARKPLSAPCFKDEVVLVNADRRHLTSSQRAMVAVDALPHFEEEAKERQGTRTDIREIIPEGEHGKATERAAEALNTNPHYVSDAKAIQEKAPEQADAIRKGEKTILCA